MKFQILSLIACSALIQLKAEAQAPTVPAKIEVKDLKVEIQQTPQIQASNVLDKKWKPKNWVEMSMELETKLPRDAGGRDGSLAAVEVKYYLGINQTSKDGKNIVLTGSVTYQNIPAGECHMLAFVSPSTLKRILLKDNGGKADVRAFGVEVRVDGAVLAVKSSAGAAWWVDAKNEPSDKYAYEDGVVLPKNKTPFAPFWGDYDVPAADK